MDGVSGSLGQCESPPSIYYASDDVAQLNSLYLAGFGQKTPQAATIGS